MTEPTNNPEGNPDTFISDIEKEISINGLIDRLHRAGAALRLSIEAAESAGSCARPAKLNDAQLLQVWHAAIALIGMNFVMVSAHLEEAVAFLRSHLPERRF